MDPKVIAARLNKLADTIAQCPCHSQPEPQDMSDQEHFLPTHDEVQQLLKTEPDFMEDIPGGNIKVWQIASELEKIASDLTQA